MLIVDRADVVSYYFFGTISSVLGHQKRLISKIGAKHEDMKCPYCGNQDTEVVETRDSEDLGTIRRRRECAKCAKRFTTYERIENINLIVIKKDGKREQFDRDKLKEYLKLDESFFTPLLNKDGIVVDVKGVLRGKIKNQTYWSL